MSDAPKYKLAIDARKCVGHGRCYDVVPDLFEPGDDEGRARVLVALVPPDQLDAARFAVNNCPESAIALTPLPDD